MLGAINEATFDWTATQKAQGTVDPWNPRIWSLQKHTNISKLIELDLRNDRHGLLIRIQSRQQVRYDNLNIHKFTFSTTCQSEQDGKTQYSETLTLLW
jgi:hypothetical protein